MAQTHPTRPIKMAEMPTWLRLLCTVLLPVLVGLLVVGFVYLIDSGPGAECRAQSASLSDSGVNVDAFCRDLQQNPALNGGR